MMFSRVIKFQKYGKILKVSQLLLSRMITSVKVPCPAFTTSDMSRTGKYLSWRILDMLIHSRRNHFEMNGMDCSFLDYKEVTRDRYTFFGSVRTTIAKDFYREIGDRLMKKKIPLESLSIETKLGYVGNKSISLDYSLLQSANNGASSSDEKVLALNTCQMVLIDKKTRLPSPLPEWWIQKYGQFSNPQKQLKLKKIEVPFSSLIFVHHLKVAWNHTDFYHHTNFNSYVNFCFEVANHAVHADFFSDGFKCSGDILNREVSLIEMLYLKESLAGENLRVSMWVEELDDQLLRFSFEKLEKGGTSYVVICQGSLGFY